MNNEFTVYREDDESVEYNLNGKLVAWANHDSHGWEGITKVESTIEAIAHILSIPIREIDTEEAGNDSVDGMGTPRH